MGRKKDREREGEREGIPGAGGGANYLYPREGGMARGFLEYVF